MFRITQKLPASVLRVTGPATLKLQQHSPQILFAAGVAGAVTSTVLACKATLKLNDVLAQAEADKNILDSIEITDEYTEKVAAKNQAALKIRTVGRVAKLYGPALFVGVVSVASLTGSHFIMSTRQNALMAAYVGLDKAFSEYQKRVADEIGVEKEEHLRYGIESISEKNDEGKTVKRVKVAETAGSMSPYARFFDESATEWDKNGEYNFLKLKAKQEYFTNLLHARGYVFLNEVYESLGMPHSQAGQVVGWIVSEGSDNFVDFGCFTGDEARIRDFVNRNEKSVFLDFNVDGPILGKLPKN